MVFTIPGEPRGKQRPRYSRKTGIIYTPSETTGYEMKVQHDYLIQGGKKIPPTHMLHTADRDVEIATAVKVEIWAFLEPPKSVPIWEKILMVGDFIFPTKKPDIDNIGKIVLDALNGAAWKDDAAVVDLTVHKRYGDVPRVVVQIDEV